MAEVDVQDPHSDSCGSPLSFDTLSSLDETNAEIHAEYAISGVGVVIELKEHIEDTIVRLHGYALQIDRAAAEHRQEQLNLYQQRDETKLDYEAYKRIGLLRGAKVHFRSASEAFQERMADSLARRRVRFDYLEKHQTERAHKPPNQHPGLFVAPKPRPAPRGELSKMSSTRNQKSAAISSPPSGRPPQDQKTGHSATLNTKLEMGSVVRQQRRSESVVSFAQEHSNFRDPPKITGASFYCPYCRLGFRAPYYGLSYAKREHWM